ncbi:hypothetical protein E3N88_35742 [Mikania micrantha]|uniref:CTLH domain-containing protein n=1 Tax=Mikania micrantha TaxID=192012 RepID=A0A5N6M258_9ASTR|nr:hypothetical protein E3N88_35742 [Mikania micrantha]
MRYFEERITNGEWEEAFKYLSGFTKVEDNQHSTRIFFKMHMQKYLEALYRYVKVFMIGDSVFATTVYRVSGWWRCSNSWDDDGNRMGWSSSTLGMVLGRIGNGKGRVAATICCELKRWHTNRVRQTRLIPYDFSEHEVDKTKLIPLFAGEIKEGGYTDHGEKENNMFSKDNAKAVEILLKDLKAFSSFSENSFKELALLLTLDNFRHIRLAFDCIFWNCGLNWQHKQCKEPKLNPDINTLFFDHCCGPSQPNSALASSLSTNLLLGSVPKPSGLPPLGAHGAAPPPLPPMPSNFPVWIANPAMAHPSSSAGPRGLVPPNIPAILKRPRPRTLLANSPAVAHQTAYTEHASKRSMTSEEVNPMPVNVPATVYSGPSSYSAEDLPKVVVMTLNLGSSVKSINFHPIQQILLLEIEAHNGCVNDLAFSFPNQTLSIVTCGDDMLIKIKAWLYYDKGSRLDYTAPGHSTSIMAYSADGKRLFSCGTNKDGQSFLVEWDESEGVAKRTYNGLIKRANWPVQFDTTKNQYIVAGDEWLVKYWNMDNPNRLMVIGAEGDLPASPCVRFNKEGMFLAVSTNDNGIKILANSDGVKVLRAMVNRSVDASRVASSSAVKNSAKTPSGASANATGGSSNMDIVTTVPPNTNSENQNLADRPGIGDKVSDESTNGKVTEISEPSHCRFLRLPDNTSSPMRLRFTVTRLMYTNSGLALLALAANAVHKLWKWPKSDFNSTGKATASVSPQIWQPTSGILMTNDISGTSTEDSIACFALSKNSSYVTSVSGNIISLFNMMTFKTMTTFMPPLPAATFLAFHPQDNNIIAIGMNDSSIQIYNVQIDELCLWSTNRWEKQIGRKLQIPGERVAAPFADTHVQFHQDQSRLLVWGPQQANGAITHAAYSCDSEIIYVAFEDGIIDILTASTLRLRYRLSLSSYLPSNSNKERLVQKKFEVWDFGACSMPLQAGDAYSKNIVQMYSYHGGGDMRKHLEIKAWLYYDKGSRLDYTAPGHSTSIMAYSADGKRLFSCGTNKDGQSFLVEWDESEGVAKRTYNGLIKRANWPVQFDTTKNQYIVAGDEWLVKYWNMDNANRLMVIDAEGDLPASPCVRFNKEGMLLAVSTNDNGIKILANSDGVKVLRAMENRSVDASRVASSSAVKNSAKTPSGASANATGGSSNMDIVTTVPPNTVTRLMYTNSGLTLLALAANAVHKLWKWPKSDHNSTGKATASVAPQIWQPTSGILMTNDISGTSTKDSIACFALSNNNSYVTSASGEKISLFNMMTFKTMTTFMPPPPAATFLAFHPQDNNIIAIGMNDSSVQIYNVQIDEGGRVAAPFADTHVQFHQDQSPFLVVHETQKAIFESPKLECLKQIELPAQSHFIFALKLKVSLCLSLFHMLCSKVYPLVVAAHPSKPNQFALGLTDGGVCVIEPLESEGKRGSSPGVENDAGPSSSTTENTTHQAER